MTDIDPSGSDPGPLQSTLPALDVNPGVTPPRVDELEQPVDWRRGSVLDEEEPEAPPLEGLEAEMAHRPNPADGPLDPTYDPGVPVIPEFPPQMPIGRMGTDKEWPQVTVPVEEDEE